MADRSGNSSPDIAAIIQMVIEIIVFHIKFWFATFEGIVRSFMPKEEVDVRGKFVFITGTGHGMGKYMAQQYSGLGAKVICVDINEKNNSETVKEIKQGGGDAYGYTCDVTNRDAIFELAQKVQKDHGFIEIIVNNAGIMPCRPLLEQTEKEIRLMYDINVLAHFWILQAFLPEMIAKNKGHIVAMSSCAGLFGLPNLVPYCGTKFAVRGLMVSMHEELRKLNKNNQIKFTTIYPYMVDTGLCKNPSYRFSWMKMVGVEEAASKIIHAQRTGLEEHSIPSYYLYMEKIGRVLPHKTHRVAFDFVDAHLESDNK
ncbi:lipid droplet subset dehydrogenase 1 isoform X2 [Haematobia irritans]|uniref:lipid droplet subset dehydrogenase 1 isoform X2 n=1 Tax=Haematobia irritans TaxID=7368 RepID=UPI003F50680A